MDAGGNTMIRLVLFVLIAAALACATTPTPAPSAPDPQAPIATPAPTQTPAPDVGDDIGAIAICKKFVAARLIAPAEAEWPGLFEKEEATQLGPDTWRVVSWVDASNRMGVLVRMGYTCEVSYQGDDKWRLETLDLQEP
jgi:hypothetical protein